jgi:hypothetical protein
MFYRISIQICGYNAFVIALSSLCAMILYHIMILVSSLSSLIDAPYQLFTCIKYIIQLMILSLWLALAIEFHNFSSHVTISYYDTTLISLLIYCVTSDFYLLPPSRCIGPARISRSSF